MSVPRMTGVLLAGGQSRRMGGGDKCLRQLGRKTILHHVIDRAAPQVSDLVLNANGDHGRFSTFGLPMTADDVPDFAGPLAGVLAGLDWAALHTPANEWVASFATDAPFFPHDLVERLLAEVTRNDADMACAASNGRHHPVFGLWSLQLRDALRHAIAVEGIRKVDAWTGRYRLAVAEFDAKGPDPFFNANRPEDLQRAEDLLYRS